MILSGKFHPGERLAEVRVAELLGVSRTPVRTALGALAREGLVSPAKGDRGYLVRSLTMKEVLDAIELRGVLEGVAARKLAETGLSPALAQELEDTVIAGAQAFAGGRLAPDAGAIWSVNNERFHEIIVRASGNMPVIAALDSNSHIPFSGAGAFPGEPEEGPAMELQYGIFLAAHRHHMAVLNCLKTGEGARAEALMREHSFLAADNIALFRQELGRSIL